jgi:hypothetical protein
MRPRKYPLDPLARLREKQVGDATKLLSDAIRAREDAQRAEEAATSRRDSAVEDARLLAEREGAALERGELRSEDLARAAAWGVRVEADRVELEQRLARASEGTQAAQDDEAAAQGAIARARADAEVVSRDRARWDEAERKKEQTAEEDAASEAFRGKPT